MIEYSKNLDFRQTLIVLALCMAPIFSLLIKGWVSSCLFIALFISVFGLIGKNFSSSFLFFKKLAEDKSFVYLVVVPMVLPLLVVLFTSVFKGHLELSNLDGPSRYVFGLIILFYLLKKNVQIKKNILFAILLMPIVTFFLIDFIEKKAWSLNTTRLTVHFIDPIVFGSICLTFSMLSLAVLISRNKSIVITFISLLSFIFGSYLSILSESRTGWLALPLVIYVLLRYCLGLNWLKSFFLTVVTALTLGIFLFNFSETVNKRVTAMVADLNQYKWNEVNINTSSGERISYIRMGWYYMTLRPLTGWNGLDYLVHKDDLAVAKHASSDVRVGVKDGGFHNEYINNGVKYGFFGFLFSFALVVCPAIFFIVKLSHNKNNISAVLGLVLTTMFFFSCFTYQVLDFKFTISLYTIMLISLVVGSLQNEHSSPVSIKSA